MLVTKHFTVAIDFHSRGGGDTIEVSGYHQLFDNRHFSKYLLLCKTHTGLEQLEGKWWQIFLHFCVNFPFKCTVVWQYSWKFLFIKLYLIQSFEDSNWFSFGSFTYFFQIIPKIPNGILFAFRQDCWLALNPSHWEFYD